MPSRKSNREKAEILSRRLKRRFYKGAAAATLIYVALSLLRFPGEIPYLPYMLAVVWAVFILCYTTFKEVLKWNDLNDKESEAYHGEFWASVILAGAGWMIMWNIVREWVFNVQSHPFPEDYQAVVVETIA